MSAYSVDIAEKEVKVSPDMSPEYMRYFCLYWDRIMLLDAPPISYGGGQEKEILKDAGILSVRSAFNPDWEPTSIRDPKTFGKQLTKYVMTRHFPLFAEEVGRLMQEEPGKWTIHQNGSQLILPKEHRVEQLTAKMQLTNCLPVPRGDISLDKVLDFKLNRSDELEGLHTTLTELYLKIVQSQDLQTAQDFYVKQLSQAVRDLNSASHESFGFCHLASRKVSLELSGASFGGALALSTVFDDPISKMGAFAIGGLLSSVKLTMEKSLEYKGALGTGKLSYLSSIQKNGLSAC
ncbi:DUF6236 family protein [Aliivibrio sp. EL58]|uniref:DUF6236 family protein n=1 Tax=Aliivibrio sp. EL58 TaxID=2107582 RepID=UPI000EFC4FB9|nr:DUF6236 family protein [Aliivibrio sp. EL58]